MMVTVEQSSERGQRIIRISQPLMGDFNQP